MASVEDRWLSAKPGPDGRKAKKAHHGTGRRSKVHYTDPDGRPRSKSAFAPPKGGKDRDVPLADSLALRLSAHLAVYPAAVVTLPWKEPGGKLVTAALMFTKPDEGAIWGNDFNRYVWHPALKATGVTPGRENGFHQLRHHFASTLLRDGVDIRELAEHLGHHDPGFTLRVYCYLMPGAPDRMRQAIDRAFSDPELKEYRDRIERYAGPFGSGAPGRKITRWRLPPTRGTR